MIEIEKQIEEAAEVYAHVKKEGLNSLGQMKYSAENYHDLELRHQRIPAFKAGASEFYDKGFRDGLERAAEIADNQNSHDIDELIETIRAEIKEMK